MRPAPAVLGEFSYRNRLSDACLVSAGAWPGVGGSLAWCLQHLQQPLAACSVLRRQPYASSEDRCFPAGMICEQLGDLEMAEAFHERRLQLAGHAVGALAGEEQPLGGADALQQGPRVQTASMEELAAHESLIQVWQGL